MSGLLYLGMGSDMTIGMWILTLTSLLARDGFFLLVVRIDWVKAMSSEIKCQFLWTACLIVWLLSLNILEV